MNDERTAQTVLFPDLFSKPIVIKRDQEHSSSDGGALLLKAIDHKLGLTKAVAEALRDSRQSGKVTHSLEDLVRQRVFGIALGHPDANDSQRLADDPIHKLLLGRDPWDGERLASQPSISRFENAAARLDLYRACEAIGDAVIERHRRRLRGRKRGRLITLDFDPTDDPTHGQQELSFYHGYYDTHCYLPMIGTIAFDQEKEQYLLCAVLRPGNSPAQRGFVAVVSRVLEKVWAAFPKARIRVRLDAGFGAPEVLDFLDANGVEYLVGLVPTKPLKRRARHALAEAKRRFRETGETVPVFGGTWYQTKTTWPAPRRVIFKAEVVQAPGREDKNNLRFVVTNMKQTPKWLYRTYTDRGDAENRIKELKNDLAIDRTSCSRFLANQLRVLLTATAYVLMQELRLSARATDCQRAQASTLRLRLLKLAAWVEVSARRVVVHLPRSFPGDDAWMRIATAAGGIPT